MSSFFHIYSRDGTVPDYRPVDALTNMTVIDYNDYSFRIVCKRYEIDNLMQRSLGFDFSSK